MNLKDRYLIIRRALIIALNPKTECVLIKVGEKSGHAYSRTIFTNKEKATEFFTNDAMDTWKQGATNAEQLAKRVTGFAKMIQDEWNVEHPEDKANFVNEKD
ncbi:hypothetical protein [Acinetobacter sp. CFCC 11171]|uniref:hypothetical protein n=1 Tax=Acinetobacter sp. CFCC 11171 TaxID=1775558 RepID=UPI000DD0000E|nr:hypothetical protein [Acinetobacter sp. CFCC 11171]